MKFTLSWLKDHLETDASLDAILEALTDLGLEVEEVVDPSKTLGAFQIVKVAKAHQHPNADKLRVCQVETYPDGPGGRTETVQVVCGAPNARAGMVGVFAAPGVYVPGTDLLLKAGEIRGEASNGMLCSERELMISDAHDGIIDLPPDAPLGARFIEYAGLDDPMIEIAITPNRPDALGVRGVARDLAARGLGRLKLGAEEHVSGAFKSAVSVSLDAAVKAETDGQGAACPQFVGREIRGLTNGPSPDWMQRRLRAIGIAPRDMLVDVTNYVSYDRCRPLHAFDADKLSGNVKVRLSKDGERMVDLFDAEHVFDAEMTLICDKGGRRPVAIGGVMGGKETGCSTETTRVFLESAYFDPLRTAATGRKLRIASDARYRFERGVDPTSQIEGIELATRLILEACGGEASELVVAGRPPKSGRNGVQRKFKLDTERVESLVGMEIPRERQVEILTALGFDVSNARSKVATVAPPPWRPDVHGEADLVEEVARVASLSKLEARPLAPVRAGVQKPILTPAQKRAGLARRTFAARGAHECVTYTFVSEEEAAAFGGGAPETAVENPIASDKSHMRPSPFPGLAAAAARNRSLGMGDVALFEVGAGFHGGEPGEQFDVAAILRVGQIAGRHWSGARRPVDLYDAKADAEAVLSALGAPVEKLMIDRETPPWMHPGRSARLKLGPKTPLALFGELHPRTAAAFGLRGVAVAALVHLDAIPAKKAKSAARPALTLHDLQSVERDFAFVVDARCEAADVLAAARKADKALIVDARVFDVFDGARAAQQLGEGKKSIAVSVTLQPTVKTLTDADIDAIGNKIVASVEKAVGARLRA